MGILSHLVLGPHLRTGGQKHRKLAPSETPDSSCTQMWRTLFQKTATRKSSSFHQRTANAEDRLRHPRWELRSTPIPNQLLHHLNIQAHPSDRHPNHSEFVIRFVRVVGAKRSPFGSLRLATAGCVRLEVLCSVRTLVLSIRFPPPFDFWFLVVRHEVLVLNLTSALSLMLFNLTHLSTRPFVPSRCPPFVTIFYFIFSDSGYYII